MTCSGEMEAGSQQVVDAGIDRHPTVKEARVVGSSAESLPAQTEVEVLSSRLVEFPSDMHWAPQSVQNPNSKPQYAS